MARYLAPMLSAIAGLPQPAARTLDCGILAPYRTVAVPHRSEQNLRIRRVPRKIHRTGIGRGEEDLTPCLPAVRGQENPALVVRSVGVAKRCNIHPVRILRVHQNVADL